MRYGKCQKCRKEIKKDEEYWELTAGRSKYHTKCKPKCSLGDFYATYFVNGKVIKKSKKSIKTGKNERNN